MASSTTAVPTPAATTTASVPSTSGPATTTASVPSTSGPAMTTTTTRRPLTTTFSHSQTSQVPTVQTSQSIIQGISVILPRPNRKLNRK